MSTVEDFKNASFGATATHDNGSRAMKTDKIGRSWILQNEIYLDDLEMAHAGYILDPFVPWIPTVREALDLAWDRAHEAKEGHVIPKGTRYLKNDALGMKEYIAQVDFEIWHGVVSRVRTLDPLPEPLPDWLDAPAVLARHAKHAPDSRPSLWGNLGNGLWGHVEATKRAEVWDLRDVTPLYPKETGK